MRLFIAVNFNDDVKKRLTQIQSGLKEHALKGNFSAYDNLHLTLVFIGEVNKSHDSIHEAMDGVTVSPFKLSIRDVGCFKRDRGDIWWSGIVENNELNTLQRQLSQNVSAAGFEIEKRKFSPHLTLAREVRMRDTFDSVSFSLNTGQIDTEISKISLMKSERINGVLTYTEIYEKHLS